MSKQSEETGASLTRREFLKTATAAGSTAALLATTNYAFAQGSDQIKIGLVGCGGRGTGAAADALQADPGIHLTAMGDVLRPQLERSLATLQKQEGLGSRVQVPEKNQFIGLDAYQRVIDSGVDVVLLCTPPGFRPQHIKAAVAAGKHIFAEKPMGTDVAGVLSALKAVNGGRKDRSFLSGFCYRYAEPHRAFYKRLHEGAIGPVRFVHATYLTSPVKPMPPASARPAGMSDVEWQIRNWYNFVWLSGDGLIEQACHSIDKIMWAMKDVLPARCVATGGRIHPNNEGNIFDHIDVFYEWPDGTRATMAQRQIADCPHNDNTDYVIGTKGTGTVHFAAAEMTGDTPWRTETPRKTMYQLEHDALFAAIRKNQPIREQEKMARSTLVGLMGRMAAYTGAAVTWDDLIKSNEDLFPKELDWNGRLPIAPMAKAGKPALA
ncbi:MAG TPA: Gfo/Idh/MocA family oxidoreductase [Armatimonadota bacterium]|nr:Gfo/Idh/MocA family oxidoreductase [Armatimonadota bacterium]